MWRGRLAAGDDQRERADSPIISVVMVRADSRPMELEGRSRRGDKTHERNI